VFTLPFGLSVIPVENPALASPVLGPTGASSWIVPSKPFKLVMVSIVSAQYPSEILTLLGLADTVKSGVVARTGLASPTVPKIMSVNSMTIIVLELIPFRKMLYLSDLSKSRVYLIGHLSALYTSAHEHGFSTIRIHGKPSVLSESPERPHVLKSTRASRLGCCLRK
jgi:hypothetical protein